MLLKMCVWEFACFSIWHYIMLCAFYADRKSSKKGLTHGGHGWKFTRWTKFRVNFGQARERFNLTTGHMWQEKPFFIQMSSPSPPTAPRPPPPPRVAWSA